MVQVDQEALMNAIQVISSGQFPRVDLKDGTKVYRVKNIIRIDIKEQE